MMFFLLKKYSLCLFIGLLGLSIFSCTPGDNENNKNNKNNVNNTNNSNEKLSIYSVSPSSGPVSGGTEIIIYGANIDENCAVTIGGKPIVNLKYLNSSSVAGSTPAGETVGPADISIIQGIETAVLTGGFIYDNSNSSDISWCIFKSPDSTTTQVQVSTEYLYGRVFALGVTDQTGQGAGITAQIGFGPKGSDPSQDSEWQWSNATFNTDVDDGANDEYMGVVTPNSSGDYDMAFRFNSGQSWVYCDLNGSDDGYSSDNAASLTVEEQVDPVPGWCILQSPDSLYGSSGVQLDPVYGQVFISGSTDSAGEGSDVTAELGFGPVGSNPGVDPGWQWEEAQYNVDSGNNDEYVANLTINNPGNYQYSYRFSYKNGPWLYCDLNGTVDGYSSDYAGNVTVSGTGSGVVDYCEISYPDYTIAQTSTESASFSGIVYMENVTSGNGQGQGILGEIGYGNEGSDPESSPSSWTWSAAVYNASIDGAIPGDLANDEYLSTLNISVDGTYSVVFRFSADGGTTWTYCDRDGSDNGFSPSEASRILVSDVVPSDIDWCIFQYPFTTTFEATNPSEEIFGRVYVAGVTEGFGMGGTITSEIGYSTSASDPISSPGDWVWETASYNISVDGLTPGDLANDEYVVTISPSSPGVYNLVYRFSRDGGASWTYCDTTGTDDGFSMSDVAMATVTSATALNVISVSPSYGSVLASTPVTITGNGFTSATDIKFGTESCIGITLNSPNSISCTVPDATSSRVVDVTAINSTENSTLSDGYIYTPMFTPTVDSTLTEWDSKLFIGSNSVTSDWGSNNVLNSLYLSYDATNLYFGVNGLVDTGNGLLIFIDKDFGSGTGISAGSSLSDNSGSLDYSISGSFDFSHTGYGIDYVAGTLGMHNVSGSTDDLAGLRWLQDPTDFGWLAGTFISTSSTGGEFMIPLTALNLTNSGVHHLGIIVVISSPSGDSYSNQSLPEGITGGVLSSSYNIDIVVP